MILPRNPLRYTKYALWDTAVNSAVHLLEKSILQNSGDRKGDVSFVECLLSSERCIVYILMYREHLPKNSTFNTTLLAKHFLKNCDPNALHDYVF